jgi:hypothetical protein
LKVTALPKGSAPVNTAGERELLIHSLRLAVARSRLVTNALETIGVSLRHRAIDNDAAMKWLHEEGLLDCVIAVKNSKKMQNCSTSTKQWR